MPIRSGYVRTLLGLAGALASGGLLLGCAGDAPQPQGGLVSGADSISPGRGDWNFSRPTTNMQESLLYVAGIEYTEPGQTPSPDAIAVVDVEPGSPTYGQIIDRVDMNHVGDELHHFGYNWDNSRLEVDGLFSGRVYMLDVKTDERHPKIVAENDNLISDSGYAVPHTVVALPDGTNLVTMIGNSGFDYPGGLVEVDGQTGQFLRPFGADATRDYNTVGPKYMYDVGFKPELNRMVTTTFGRPLDVAGGINPGGLGNIVSVWDFQQRKVIQTADLGTNCGALEVRWTTTPGEPVGYTNCPGTSSIWAWEDYDGDGVYTFHQFLAGQLGIPVDIVMSPDSKYMYVTDWLTGRVLQVSIEDRMNPVITAEVDVPYAQMQRLSQDGKRLYVSNSLLSTWDDDPALNGPRNVNYGIYSIETGDPGMTLVGNPLVDFTHVQKKNGVGRLRPHQIFFNPEIVWPAGFH